MILKLQENPFILRAILSLLLLLTLLWAYWPVITRLLTRLAADEDYSFGLLLPLVSAYIVYLKWPRISQLALTPAWTGLAVLFAGLILYVLGELSTDQYSPALSFVVSLGGVVFLAGGWGLLLLVLFPLFLLFFMIPLPQFLIQKLTLPLQMLSSRLATAILHLFGVPAVRQGNIIDLGVRQLQVVAACSGLRYILALLALGLIFCYFYQRRLWKAAILIIAVIPAAIFANALRVAAMGVYPDLQKGFWHGFTGWLIFVFCFGCLLMLNKVLNWREAQTGGPPAPENPGSDAAPSRDQPASAPLLAGIMLILAAGGLGLRLGDIPPVLLKQPLDRFPMQLGPWQGRSSLIDPIMFKATGADTYLNADYTDGAGHTINLWIAYYENQKGGGAVHSPFSCLTGSGWELLEIGTTEAAPGHPVRYMLMQQGGNKYLVYYWYLQRGRWLASEYWNKLLLSWDGLTRRRADGALVRLITPVGQEQSSVQERLNYFTQLLISQLPQFMRY
ncbi:MAG: VPLPA-CTERM-specific exosortase XrtD [Desulfobaccales bacterium]